MIQHNIPIVTEDEWKPEKGGLNREYVLCVENPYWGEKEEYNAKLPEGESPRIFMNWPGINEETGEEMMENFTCGKDWYTDEEGQVATHPEGFEKFHESTVYGSIVARALTKMGMRQAFVERFGGLPSTRYAGIWNGARFKMGPEQYKGQDGNMRTRTIPVKFLGWKGDPPKAAGHQPAKTPAAAPAAADTPAPSRAKAKGTTAKASTNGAAGIEDQLRTLAAAHDTFAAWQAAAILVPGLASHSELLPKVTQPDYYESLRA